LCVAGERDVVDGGPDGTQVVRAGARRHDDECVQPLVPDYAVEQRQHIIWWIVFVGFAYAVAIAYAAYCTARLAEDPHLWATALFDEVTVPIELDLLVSGQAWHWIEPEAGVAKAASVINPGGHLAVFWNRGRHDPGTAAALDLVYERLAPSIDKPTAEQHPAHEAHAEHFEALRSSGRFTAVEARAYPWEAVYDRAGWLDFIATQSDHVLLPDAQRSALLEAVGDVIDGLGGSIPYHFSTLLLTATRDA